MQTTNARATAQQGLLDRIKTAAARHAESGAALIVLLAHAKAVNAAEALGYASLFAFCKDELLLSRDQTYRYLACAAVYTLHPQILPALETGRLTATGVSALAGYLKAHSPAEGAAALSRAEGLTVEAIERLAAELMPKADVPCVVKANVPKQALAHALPFEPTAHGASAQHTHPATPLPKNFITHIPNAATAGPDLSALSEPSGKVFSSRAPAQRASASPLSPTSYKLTMTLSAEAYKKLRELRDLTSHSIPHGELDKVVTRAIEIALDQARDAKQKTLKRNRTLTTTQPPRVASESPSQLVAPAGRLSETTAAGHARVDDAAIADGCKEGRDAAVVESGAACRVDPTCGVKGERYIPASVRRAVWQRDAGACAFVGSNGRRCGSTWQLEVDHVIRVADGGKSTPDNTRLCCRRHNQAREKLRGAT